MSITANNITDNNLATSGFTLIEADPAPKLLIYLAQAILIIYKNVSPQSYDNFMQSRIRYLKASTSYIELGEEALIDVAIK